MRRRVIGGALALSMLAIAGGALPATAAATRVKIVDFSFKPRRVTIPQGTKVVWINKDGDAHTSTSKTGLWDSGSLSQGERFAFRFTDTGVFRYVCSFHDDMRGKVIVGDV